MRQKIWIAFLCSSLGAGSVGAEAVMPIKAMAQRVGDVYIQNTQPNLKNISTGSKSTAKFVVTKKSKEYLKKGLVFGYGINFKMNKKQMIQKFGPITGTYEYEGTLYSFEKLGNLAVSFNGLQMEDSISSVLITSNQYGKIDRTTVKRAWGKPESEGPSDEDINEYLMFYDFGNMRVFVSSPLHSNSVSSIWIIAE